MSRRFLLDVMLGTLATYLRMCGYDTLYAQEEDIKADAALRERAATTGRTLVTRDQDLAARTEGALLLETREIKAQLAELQAYDIEIALPTEPDRCSLCNGRVERIDTGQRPEHAPDAVSTVWQCRGCEQFFWKGSHWEQVQETITGLSG